MDDDRMSLLLNIFLRKGHGIHRVEYILAVAINDLEILKPLEICCRIGIGCLISLWH